MLSERHSQTAHGHHHGGAEVTAEGLDDDHEHEATSLLVSRAKATC